MRFFQDQQQRQEQEAPQDPQAPSDGRDGRRDYDDDDAASVVSFSSTSATTKNIDSILAKEMYAMSVQDRKRSQEELHGVHSSAAEEDPQRAWNAQLKLKADLDLLLHGMDRNDEHKQAFYEAYWLPDSQRYIKSEEVCLKYLRAEYFDPSKASKRMFTHLRMVHKYFGTWSLQRGLRYNDLSRQEQDVFKAGNLQILPSRDRSGRLVSILQGTLPTEVLEGQARVRKSWLRSSSGITVIGSRL